MQNGDGQEPAYRENKDNRTDGQTSRQTGQGQGTTAQDKDMDRIGRTANAVRAASHPASQPDMQTYQRLACIPTGKQPCKKSNTDGPSDGHTSRQANMQTHRCTDGQAYSQADTDRYRQTYIQADIQTDIHPYRKSYRQTHTQTGRVACKHTYRRAGKRTKLDNASVSVRTASHAGRHTNAPTCRHAQTNKLENRQYDRQVYRHTCRIL